MTFNIGQLAPLAGLQQGYMAGQQFQDERQLTAYKMALQKLALQQAQQQQQAMGIAAGGLANLPSGGGNAPLQQIPQQQPQQLQQSPMLGSPLPGQPPLSPGLSSLQNKIFGIESDFGRNPSTSSAGAVGPMQIIPSTFAQYAKPGEDINNPQQNKAVGDRIVGDLYSKSGGDAAATMVGYDAGPGAMSKFQAAGDNLAAVPQLEKPYVRAVQQEIGTRAGVMLKAGVPQPAVQQSAQAATGAIQQLDPSQIGRSSLTQLWHAVDKAAPDGDPVAKFLAVGMLQKMMAPEDQMAFKLYAQQNQAELRVGLAQMQAQNAEHRLQENILAQAGRQQTALGAAADRQQTGIAAAADRQKQAQDFKVSQQGPDAPAGEVDFWANVLKSGGSLPPGLSRTASGSKLVRQIMDKMSQGGDPGDFIQKHETVKADAASLRNMTKMTDAAESFERTANANLDNALRLSQGAVPTDLGPWVNKWIETGATQFGDEKVPPYLAAVLTAANEYAKIMNGSTGSQGSTVDSRREAAELLSPYLSTGQITAVAQVLKQDMANRKRELTGQVADIQARLKQSGSGATAPAAPSGAGAPAPGTKVGNKIFKGGDPSDPNSWATAPAGSVDTQ